MHGGGAVLSTGNLGPLGQGSKEMAEHPLPGLDLSPGDAKAWMRSPTEGLENFGF